MPTIRDNATRAALCARMRSLTPASPASFGTLNAARMLCHMQDQVRIALGSTPCRERKTIYRFAPVRWLALRLPVPKGKLKTVKEMIATEPSDWQTDQDTLDQLLEQLSQATDTAPHPAFGPLSPAAWGKLTWKHFDYHLAQFGA